MLVTAVTCFDLSIVSLHVCNRVVETDGFKLSAHLSMRCSAASPVVTCCYINMCRAGSLAVILQPAFYLLGTVGCTV